MENISKDIVCSAGEKHKTTDLMKIKAKYLKLCDGSAAERHTAKSAAPAATPASAVQTDMDAMATAGGIDVVMDVTQGTV